MNENSVKWQPRVSITKYVHPDRTKAPPLRNLSIARELTLASFGICGEVQDRCEWPRKRRKLEYGIVLRVSGGGGEGSEVCFFYL